MSADQPCTLRPTEIGVSLDAIRHNVRRLAEVAGTEVCVVVKADGYGHGAVPVASAAVEAGASWLAVALVEEGVELRQAGIEVPVLLLSEPHVAAVPALLDAGLTPTVYRRPFVAVLDAAAHARGRTVAVHAKVDTGMGRVGVPLPDWEPFVRELASSRHLTVEGIWTHLARADETAADDTTAGQLAGLARAVSAARRLGLAPRWVHAANTAAVLRHPAARLDLVRVGIGVYGLSPGADVDAADHGLEPALLLATQVAFVKWVGAGTPLSYGHRFHAPADGWVATLPVGYADGLPRGLSDAAEVLLGGRRFPIAGTVTMDQTLVWCGDHRPEVGDEVMLLGPQGGDRLRLEDWAAPLGTITYELATQLTSRVPRRYH